MFPGGFVAGAVAVATFVTLIGVRVCGTDTGSAGSDIFRCLAWCSVDNS